MSEQKIDIVNKYSQEIREIGFKLQQLEENRVYGLNSIARGDGSLTTNVSQLRKMIIDLISKIQNGKDSDMDKLSELFKQ